MSVDDFNAMSRPEAEDLVRPCLDIDRWVEALVDGRPYVDSAELLDRAASAAAPFTSDEIEGALRHHPRIGERASGTSTESQHSRAEQGAVSDDATTARRLADGNRRYEEHFGRVFLVRAAGRTAEEILEILRSRLENDPDAEDRVVADQLREIAVLRLQQAVSA